MIYKEHLVELYVNGDKVELEDQDSVNMRFNNVLFDPTKISSTQAEYSFEFNIPMTKKNNVIFDHANNLSKLNKFHNRYDAEVYADGTLLFTGTITLNGFEKGMYKVNLVSVKVYSLEEIFGDSVMSDINNYYIDFEGVDTINLINAMEEPEVKFPMISYGVPQKAPYYKDDVASDYTDKFDLDKYNRWYVETFYPSHNMLTTLRKAFEYKGYTVIGDVFDDKFLKNIYMSTHLADGQDPTYNLANPKFGSINLNVNWSTPTYTSGNTPYLQDLTYPYFRVGNDENRYAEATSYYNFDRIQVYDMLNSEDGGSVTVNQNVAYLYQPNEHIIVIPADGFYKIDMSISASLQDSSNFNAIHYIRDGQDWSINERQITLTPNFYEICPLEIQLVRNYEDNIELIKGKWNKYYFNGNPNDTTFDWWGIDLDDHTAGWHHIDNIREYKTCFPHEAPKCATPLPTKMNDLTSKWTPNLTGDWGDVYANRELMCYDNVVGSSFVCGFTSLGKSGENGVPAVMKNGYSWSRRRSEENYAFYNQKGYNWLLGIWGSVSQEYSGTLNKNEYLSAPTTTFSTSQNSMNGSLSCMVYLKKNDVLNLMAIQRDYTRSENGADVTHVYNTRANVRLKISAASPYSYAKLKNENFNYNSPSQFDSKLNLANFFNNEKKISEWIENIVDAFNLDIKQNGKVITIDVHRKMDDSKVAVDIDDRVNYTEAASKIIDYPKSMSVKYKIDTDEWGAERSAIEANGGDDSIMNTDEWKNYINSGYTVINLNDDSYVTTTSDKNLQFSYTWYDDFNWYPVTSDDTATSTTPVKIRMPVISKYSYMIDSGHDYENSMQHDGYGLAQRFWFEPKPTNCYVWTDTYPPQRVTLYVPQNVYTNYSDLYFNLSYKNTERSLLTEYFNINAYLASNYVELDVYLTPEEYNRIKNGSMIHFDSDLYYPVEISGYDPTGNNPTTLKMMKKVN